VDLRMSRRLRRRCISVVESEIVCVVHGPSTNLALVLFRHGGGGVSRLNSDVWEITNMNIEFS
jgi:hypothetical protein